MYLTEVFSAKLPPVPEDCAVSELSYRASQSFPDLTLGCSTPTLAQTDISQSSQPVYQPIGSFAEPLNRQQTPLETKSSVFYSPKVCTPQSVYHTNLASPNPARSFICSDALPVTPVEVQAVVTGPYKFESENSSRRNMFSSGKAQQPCFKMLGTSSKISFKHPQYQKIPPLIPASNQYNRVQQNFDLAVNSQEPALPDLSVTSPAIKDTMRSNSLPAVNKTEVFTPLKVGLTYNYKFLK